MGDTAFDEAWVAANSNATTGELIITNTTEFNQEDCFTTGLNKFIEVSCVDNGAPFGSVALISPTTHQTPRTTSQLPTMAQKAMSLRSLSMLDAMLTLFHHQWELSPPVRTAIAHSQSKSPMMHHNFSTSKPPPPQSSISSLLQLSNFFLIL